MRTKKGNKEYIWSGDRILGEKENGKVTMRYFYDASGIAGYEYSGTKFVFRKNLQGDIIGIIDNTGTLLGTYEYDAWGNCTATKVIISGTSMVLSMNPFRYRGYYFDSETGLYYLQSRYYDPKVGRFISPDAYSYLEPETVNGLNLYSYCNNNPVMNVDPDGHFVLSSFLIGLGIAALIGASAGVVSYTAGVTLTGILSGNWSWSWGMFLGSTIGGAITGALGFLFQGIPGIMMSGLNGLLSTSIGMNLANAFGEADYSSKDIALNAFGAGAMSMIFYGFTSQIKVPGITGRGGIGQVSKQIYTKFFNGSIRSITLRTFGKMLVYELYYNALDLIAAGVINAIIFNVRSVKNQLRQLKRFPKVL